MKYLTGTYGMPENLIKTTPFFQAISFDFNAMFSLEFDGECRYDYLIITDEKGYRKEGMLYINYTNVYFIDPLQTS